MNIEWEKIVTLEGLKQLKNKINSSDGPIGILKLKLKNASREQKADIGKELKEAMTFYESKYEQINKQIEAENIRFRNEKFRQDPFQNSIKKFGLHPLTLISNRIEKWFLQNGYYSAPSSHIIDDELNFEALNIPKDHPAREMQDSLYFKNDKLLRTHNTGWSIYQLQQNPNKSFSHFTIGPVYRNDIDDQTHSHQFSQCDFVSVGHFTINNLIYTLKNLLSYVMEEEVKIRMRPSFFPFTEPSVEVDMFYDNRWIEVLGAGMLHPKVLMGAKYTNSMSAFAAGIGIERLAMIKYKVKDIRDFYLNDLRFIENFK
ncbi:phenylalanyl-tRNA synthetase alpha subunit [Mycoplasma testudineum]|uniref:phenylalanine--tRNA ligase n=1 Tax=Mycoplasma testudineum TaxID=244584 RepID=A0A4R6IG47_9MOLU|nr:phenylalanine--tRNA ligase subunit alpha [Mycoplasma testudineum]OYD27124.1 phenylalanine--tRNA ligase subunit alpha [Mycoplasma testudineum]TDO21122.1 phenylalanyl-tRNA synthetase alpha subunit [Mycoplasma testudineum]